MQASDGNFYGVTSRGGGATAYNFNTGAGTVFKLAPGGEYQVLHRFDIVNDGGGPNTPLVEGSDGLLYGSSSCASQTPNAGGALFRMSRAGVFTVLERNGLYCDNDLPDPVISIAKGSDGILYVSGRAGISAMTEGGIRTTICAIPACPVSPLIEADDRKLYLAGGPGARTIHRDTDPRPAAEPDCQDGDRIRHAPHLGACGERAELSDQARRCVGPRSAAGWITSRERRSSISRRSMVRRITTW